MVRSSYSLRKCTSSSSQLSTQSVDRINSASSDDEKKSLVEESAGRINYEIPMSDDDDCCQIDVSGRQSAPLTADEDIQKHLMKLLNSPSLPYQPLRSYKLGEKQRSSSTALTTEEGSVSQSSTSSSRKRDESCPLHQTTDEYCRQTYPTPDERSSPDTLLQDDNSQPNLNDPRTQELKILENDSMDSSCMTPPIDNTSDNFNTNHLLAEPSKIRNTVSLNLTSSSKKLNKTKKPKIIIAKQQTSDSSLSISSESSCSRLKDGSTKAVIKEKFMKYFYPPNSSLSFIPKQIPKIDNSNCSARSVESAENDEKNKTEGDDENSDSSEDIPKVTCFPSSATNGALFDGAPDSNVLDTAEVEKILIKEKDLRNMMRSNKKLDLESVPILIIADSSESLKVIPTSSSRRKRPQDISISDTVASVDSCIPGFYSNLFSINSKVDTSSDKEVSLLRKPTSASLTDSIEASHRQFILDNSKQMNKSGEGEEPCLLYVEDCQSTVVEYDWKDSDLQEDDKSLHIDSILKECSTRTPFEIIPLETFVHHDRQLSAIEEEQLQMSNNSADSSPMISAWIKRMQVAEDDVPRWQSLTEGLEREHFPSLEEEIENVASIKIAGDSEEQTAIANSDVSITSEGQQVHTDATYATSSEENTRYEHESLSSYSPHPNYHFDDNVKIRNSGAPAATMELEPLPRQQPSLVKMQLFGIEQYSFDCENTTDEPSPQEELSPSLMSAVPLNSKANLQKEDVSSSVDGLHSADLVKFDSSSPGTKMTMTTRSLVYSILGCLCSLYICVNYSILSLICTAFIVANQVLLRITNFLNALIIKYDPMPYWQELNNFYRNSSIQFTRYAIRLHFNPSAMKVREVFFRAVYLTLHNSLTDLIIYYSPKDILTEIFGNIPIFLDLVWIAVKQPLLWFFFGFIFLTLYGLWKLLLNPIYRLSTYLTSARHHLAQTDSPQKSIRRSLVSVKADPDLKLSELKRQDSWLTKFYNVVNSSSNLSSQSLHRFQYHRRSNTNDDSTLASLSPARTVFPQIDTTSAMKIEDLDPILPHMYHNEISLPRSAEEVETFSYEKDENGGTFSRGSSGKSMSSGASKSAAANSVISNIVETDSTSKIRSRIPCTNQNGRENSDSNDASSGKTRALGQAMRSALRVRKKVLSVSSLATTTTPDPDNKSTHSGSQRPSLASAFNSNRSNASGSDRGLSVSFSKRNDEMVYNVDRPPSALDNALKDSAVEARAIRSQDGSPLGTPVNAGGVLFGDTSGVRNFFSQDDVINGLSVPDRPNPTAVHSRTQTFGAPGYPQSESLINVNGNFDMGDHPLKRDPAPLHYELPKPSNTRTYTAPVDMFSSNILTRGESLLDDGADWGDAPQNSGQQDDDVIDKKNDIERHPKRLPVIRTELLLTDSYDAGAVDELDDESFVALMDDEQLNRAICMDIDSLTPTSPNSRRRLNDSKGEWQTSLEYLSSQGDGSLTAPDTTQIGMNMVGQSALTHRTLAYNNLSEAQIAKRDEVSRKNLSLFFLKSLHGFPTGVAKACFNLQEKFPLRIWLVDNSGSMQTGDGKRFFHGKGKVKQMLNCRRWDELADAVASHAALAKDLGTPMIFRLLNDPNIGREDLLERLPQVLGICARRKYALCDVVDQVSAAATIMKAAMDDDACMSSRKSKWNSIKEKSKQLAMEAGNSDGSVNSAGGDTGVSQDTRSFSKWVLFQSKIDQEKKLAKAASTINQIAPSVSELNKRKENFPPEASWEGVWEIDIGQKDQGRDLSWMDRAQMDLELLRKVMDNSEPRYKTPLAGHMVAIHDQIKGMLPSLKEQKQKVVVIIATDGIPTDKDVFLGALHMLQKQPVEIIVRLCTDDQSAIHFWNTLNLDFRRLEIEILDDFEAEAEAVASMNPWFNYAMPLQRAREFGFRHTLITTLKERPLTYDELRDFCALLFGVSASKLPHPKLDWETFYTDIEALLTRESKQWNPVLTSTKPWISKSKMAEQYGGKREKIRKAREGQLLKAENHSECCAPTLGNVHESSSVMANLGCTCIIL